MSKARFSFGVLNLRKETFNKFMCTGTILISSTFMHQKNRNVLNSIYFQLFDLEKDIREQNSLKVLNIEIQLKTNLLKWEEEAIPTY
ncbi:hypothetical protein [Flavivirga algicola]|uniref:Uncharacterized protein n=1 Tax=Flavivirga algicola TaxID=2729136 RepID=A0ABX1RTD0_9FLAO|nr:hypothetical protein [Flavivirga algicola]NMH86806.1 hypothetical protein [Flavivirga algicola]